MVARCNNREFYFTTPEDFEVHVGPLGRCAQRMRSRSMPVTQADKPADCVEHHIPDPLSLLRRARRRSVPVPPQVQILEASKVSGTSSHGYREAGSPTTGLHNISP